MDGKKAALIVATQERRKVEDEVSVNNRMGALCTNLQTIPADSELGKKLRTCLDNCDFLLEA